MSIEFECGIGAGGIENKTSVDVTTIVAVWIQQEAEKGNMLFKTAEEIAGEISEGRGIVIYDEEGEPVAYGRYLVWNDSLIEVGSVVVAPDRRREGLGTKVNLEMIDKARQAYPGAMIFALAENSDSEKMYKKMGGRPVDNNSLDNVVWELCGKKRQECTHYSIFPDCPCIPFDLTDLVARG